MAANSPGIEIRRHDSISLEQWAVLRPKLRLSADMAIEIASEYGMELSDRKYANFQAAENPRSPEFAEAITSKTSNYFFSPSYANGRIDIGFVARKMFHELVHQFREEVHPTDVVGETVGDLAATEGLAFNLEYLSVKQGLVRQWNYQFPSLYECVLGMSVGEVSDLYDELAEDIHKPIYDEDMIEKWWSARNRKLGARAIDAVGILAVREQLRQGYVASEIWRLPTLEVLGYDEAYEAAA